MSLNVDSCLVEHVLRLVELVVELSLLLMLKQVVEVGAADVPVDVADAVLGDVERVVEYDAIPHHLKKSTSFLKSKEANILYCGYPL